METEYSMLTEETRKLINKAIDIFDNLVDKDIKYALPRDRGVLKFEFVDYSLNNDEKVELSLFLAGLELEGNIKKVINDYEPKFEKQMQKYKKEEAKKIFENPNRSLFSEQTTKRIIGLIEENELKKQQA